jgi:hypothetical protein
MSPAARRREGFSFLKVSTREARQAAPPRRSSDPRRLWLSAKPWKSFTWSILKDAAPAGVRYAVKRKAMRDIRRSSDEVFVLFIVLMLP